MISRTGLHAVRALARLATIPRGEFAGAGALAAEIRAPANYLGKLLHALTAAGLVESRKGAGGGFRLARAADTIALLDVVEPIEGTEGWRDCFLGLEGCDAGTRCAVHDRWVTLRESYLAMLRETSIADIVADINGGRQG